MVNGGAVVWKNCSAWSLEKMIQRSGSSARSLLPTSAATSRTWATSALSSVSGMVKNCGAWGSMAPPITADIMVGLLGREGIARGAGQQARRAISRSLQASDQACLKRGESGLDRLDSVSGRVGQLVKDRRPPEAAALRAVL